MQSIARNMPLQRAWPEAIVVFMQGVNTPSKTDPEGKHPGWQHTADDYGGRDLKFFDAVLAAVCKKYSVDDKRICAVGFSNGGFFTYLLWSERPNTFAAFASCSGLIWPALKLTVPKPAFVVAGETDRLFSPKEYQATIEQVRQVDRATGPGKPGDDGTMLYASDKGAPVETIVHPGGHALPPHAVRRIVEFLQSQQLNKSD